MQKNILEIEQKILNLEQAKKESKTHEFDKELKELKKSFNVEYLNLKNILLLAEKENLDRLFFLHSSNGFEKLFGNSALFFQDGISPKLNLSSRILNDSDYRNPSPTGCCSIRNFKKLESRLLKIGCLLDEANTRPGLTVYKLPWTYREKDLKRLIENNQMFIGKFEKTIMAQDIYPTLFVNLNDFSKTVYENIRKSKDPTFKEIIGYEYSRLVFSMKESYIRFCNNQIDRSTTLTEIETTLELIRAKSKIISDLDVWTPAVCARIADYLKNIRTILDNLKKRN